MTPAMTPAEANGLRRAESIRRAHRIDALAAGQLVNFIHRLAAIESAAVDQVLAEFDANAPKPRNGPRLHPVRVYAATDPEVRLEAGLYLRVFCDLCGWAARLDDGHTVADLLRLAREHSGIEP